MTIKTFLPIIFTASLFGAAPVAAEMSSQWVCELDYKISSFVMEMRQDGLPMPEAMAQLDSTFKEGTLLELSRVYVQRVYRMPRHTDPALQLEAILEYANHNAAECYEDLNK